MPVLEFINELKPNDDPLICGAEIMSVMAYPKNDSNRSQFFDKTSYFLFVEHLWKLKRTSENEEIDVEYFNFIKCVVDEMAVKVAPLLLVSPDYDKSLDKAFPGAAAMIGEVVRRMVVIERVDPNLVSKSRALQYVVDNIDPEEYKLSRRTINDAWDKYKTVGHFWAAYGDVLVENLSDPERTKYNVITNNCEKILSYALFYQNFLLNYNSSNNRRANLSQDNMWLIPNKVYSN